MVCDDVIEQPLTKSEFITMYGRCGDGVHLGSLRSITKSFSEETINVDEIVSYVKRLKALLRKHRIASADANTQHLCQMESKQDGQVTLFKAFAETPL